MLVSNARNYMLERLVTYTNAINTPEELSVNKKDMSMDS